MCAETSKLMVYLKKKEIPHSKIKRAFSRRDLWSTFGPDGLFSTRALSLHMTSDFSADILV